MNKKTQYHKLEQRCLPCGSMAYVLVPYNKEVKNEM